MESPRPDNPSSGPEAKRRKVRKGTRSCWECKRRKVKCTFASDSDATCVPCRRRNATCVGQEVPEELVPSNKREQGHRIERMEMLLKQLGVVVDPSAEAMKPTIISPLSSTADLAQHSTGDFASTYALPTPGQSDSTPTPASHLPPPTPLVPPHGGPSAPTLTMRAEFTDSIYYKMTGSYVEKLGRVSKALYAALPALHDVEKLCSIFKGAVCFATEISTRSLHDLERDGPQTIDHLARIPGPETHPVLLARWMLHFALFLQQSLPLDSIELSEDPKILAQRLKDTATCFVTTNEELVGTLESLECILLEAVYENCRGHFRRAWMGLRRAMTAAQLMSLHRSHTPSINRVDPNCTVNPRCLWFRIIYLDRFLCLMLGLPVTSLDVDLTVGMAKDTSGDQLQRVHAMVAKRILERNEADLSVDSYALTEAIDAHLLEAAEKVPHQFWQPLDFSGYGLHDVRIFWETHRLVEQISHFNLLNHLHSPYLVPFNNERYSSSKITCAHASREIISRWTSFRTRHALSACCRVGDFIALRAGLALCLAHLSNHHNAKPLPALRHQRLGDRSLLEQTLELMEMLVTKVDDILARESSDLLRRILDFEANAARGQVYSAQRSSQEEGIEGYDGTALSIVIPYFGAVKITPEGMISKESSATRPLRGGHSVTTHQRPSINRLPDPRSICLEDFYPASGNPIAPFAYASPENLAQVSTQPQTSVGLCSSALEPPQPQAAPFPVAGLDDWVFQGVDIAFFDSLMRGMSEAPTF